MINVVYLIILFRVSGEAGITSQSIMQANMKQCEINQSLMIKQKNVRQAHCIVGVK